MQTYSEAFEQHLATAPMAAFVEQVGSFFDRFGFRRNLGRVWATLFLAPEPLNQAQVAQLCGLSAGLVSAAIKELVHWRAIRVVPRRGNRAIHYEAEEQLLRTVAAILAKRELEAVRQLREAAIELRSCYRPLAKNKVLAARLRSVEHVADLYELFTGVIAKMAGLPTTVLEQTQRVTKFARMVERATARRSN